MKVFDKDGKTSNGNRFAVELKLLSLMKRSERILCVSHVVPDGDAIGSLLGMGWILRALGKEPTLALEDPAPENFDFMPGVGDIVNADQVAADYDLIICLDASSPDRMGRVYRPDEHGEIPLIVIDHHVTNTRFGTINWVEPGCAATCQMLVYLAEALGVPLTGNVAVSLLTGLVTDTLGFQTSNTDTEVLRAAMQLVDGGANLPRIVAQTLRRRRFAVLRLWGLILSHVQLDDGVIWATISQSEIASAGTDPGDDGGLASQLITAQEADISATFTEKTGDRGQPLVVCSFRAKPGFDVSKVAFELGGGGHPPAAGCTLTGSLDEVAHMVVARLKSARQKGLNHPNVREKNEPSA
jgi:phosphoesterase RecJ-like protein